MHRFLDQYYSQFDDRVQESQVDYSGGRFESGKSMRHRMPYKEEPQMDLMTESSRRQGILKKSDMMEEEYGDFDLDDLPTYQEMILEQPASPNTRYVQHVALPKSGQQDDSTYMYSAVHPSELEANDLNDEPRKILPGFLYSGTKPSTSQSFSPIKTSYSESKAKQGFDSTEPSYSEREYQASGSSYSSSSSTGNPVSKFLGLTGTTSQDIQVNIFYQN